jgi:hypothetical protein
MLDEERARYRCPPWEVWYYGQDPVAEDGVCWFETLDEALEAAQKGLAEQGRLAGGAR